MFLGESYFLWGKNRDINIAVPMAIIIITFMIMAVLFYRKVISTSYLRILAVIIFVLFICFGFIHCRNYYERIYLIENEEFNGEKIYITGKIEFIEKKNYGTYCYITGAKIQGIKKHYVDKVVLCFDCDVDSKYFLAGKTIGCSGKVNKFKKVRNDGGFDEGRYYISKGIAAKLKADYEGVQITGKEDWIRSELFVIKSNLIRKLESITPKKYIGLYKGIIFGEKNEIDSETKDLYKMSGISHLLAISGLHISIIGVCLYGILRKYMGIIPAGVIGVIVVISYGIMVGSSVSTNRAVIMFVLRIMADIFGRSYDIINSLLIALLIVLIANPLCIYNSGMLLSFGAIVGITIVYDNFSKLISSKNKLLASICAGESISAVTKPVIVDNYYEICSYSGIINILVVPFMSIVVVCGIIGIAGSFLSIFAGKILIYPGCIILEIYSIVCKMFLALPYGIVIVGRMPARRIIFYYTFLCIVIIIIHYCYKYFRNEEEKKCTKNNCFVKWAKRGSFIGILVLLNIIVYGNIHRGFSVTMLDVGQGDCICIRDNENVIVTDMGSSSESNIGKNIVIPYMKYNGIKKIDYLIMTHSDSDHINGMEELLNYKYNGKPYVKNFVVGDISDEAKDEAYFKLIDTARKNKVRVIFVKVLDTIKTENSRLSFIWPKQFDNRDANQLSVVYYLRAKGVSMLFTGDLGEEGEKELIKENVLIKTNILKVGHHGSNSSSTEEFLELIRPEVALISCGEKNNYGHPGKETIKRLNQNEIDTYITTKCGQIRIYFYKNTFEINN